MFLAELAERLQNELGIPVYIDNAPSAYDTPIIIAKCQNDITINYIQKKTIIFNLIDEIGGLDGWIDSFKSKLELVCTDITLGPDIIVSQEYGRDEQSNREIYQITAYIFKEVE
jgi:hypothetical protein